MGELFGAYSRVAFAFCLRLSRLVASTCLLPDFSVFSISQPAFAVHTQMTLALFVR
eukprot:m.297782 g.297782  ORF g.297782 m.297782 type:complete len:56 (-) comp55171_c0_seq2:89-256(-)